MSLHKINLVILIGTLTLNAQIPGAPGTPSTLATMRYLDLKVGEGGPAAAGKKFTVHYTGWLTDGKKFDSSVDRNQPFVFVQGRRQVIAGWEVGFEGMKVGGRRRLFIPYQMGYGEPGNGTVIPPKAELIFDVELLGVEDVAVTPAGIDLLGAWEGLEARAMALARALPADKFTGRVSENFRRMLALNVAMLETATKDLSDEQREARLSEVLRNSVTVHEGMLAMLGQSFANVTKQLSTARAGFFTGDITFRGKLTNRRGVLVELAVEVAELAGETAAISR